MLGDETARRANCTKPFPFLAIPGSLDRSLDSRANKHLATQGILIPWLGLIKRCVERNCFRTAVNIAEAAVSMKVASAGSCISIAEAELG